MEQTDEFNADVFFDDGSLQQIDPTVELGGLGNVVSTLTPSTLSRLVGLRDGHHSQRITWSRHSHLAAISEDGSTVNLHCLQFKPTIRTWTVTTAYPTDSVFVSAVSVLWSPTGGDLAVVSEAGRITILQTTGTALNRLGEVYSHKPENVNDESEALALMWLNQDRQDRIKSVVLRSHKVNGKWSQVQVRSRTLGPVWTRALVVVYRNGKMSLTYQKPDTSWMTLSASLQSSTEIISHAAISSTLEGKLLVALHSLEGVISAINVQVDWPDPSQSLENDPTLHVDVIATAISSPTTTTFMGASVYDPDSWFLTDLSIIPPSYVETMSQLPATIAAVYTCANKSIPVSQPGYLLSSVVRRWSVTAMESKLHSKFEELQPKNVSNESRQIMMLQPQPERHDQVITSIQLVDGGQNIEVITQDGRIECLAGDDLSPLTFRVSAEEAIAMTQSGFIFPNIDPSLPLSFSPNSCVVAELEGKAKPQIKSLQYHNQISTNDGSDPSLEVAIASVILAFARACWSGPNIDDLLACVLDTFNPTQISHIIIALYHTLFRDTEFVNEKLPGSEIEKVMQKPVLIKVLSFHAALTFPLPLLQNESIDAIDRVRSRRSLSGQWVWITLNLRYVMTMLFINSKEFQIPNATMSQEIVDLVCQNIRWVLDLFRFMASVILQSGDRIENPELFGGEKDLVTNEQYTLITLLLNAHWSRTLLMAVCTAVRRYSRPPEQRSPQQTQIARMIQQYSVGKGMTLAAMESMLDARRCAVGENDGEHATIAARQIEMMATGVVPEPYQGLILRLLTTLFNITNGLRDKHQIDRTKLFVENWDMDWILLGGGYDYSSDSPSQFQSTNGNTQRVATRYRPRRIYDIHRKRLILKGVIEKSQSDSANSSNVVDRSSTTMIRRCVRCSSYNEDVNPIKKDWPKIMVVCLSKCVCDGHWIIVPWESTQLEDEDVPSTHNGFYSVS